jgi:hypothetical protein
MTTTNANDDRYPNEYMLPVHSNASRGKKLTVIVSPPVPKTDQRFDDWMILFWKRAFEAIAAGGGGGVGGARVSPTTPRLIAGGLAVGYVYRTGGDSQDRHLGRDDDRRTRSKAPGTLSERVGVNLLSSRRRALPGRTVKRSLIRAEQADRRLADEMADALIKVHEKLDHTMAMQTSRHADQAAQIHTYTGVY